MTIGSTSPTSPNRGVATSPRPSSPTTTTSCSATTATTVRTVAAPASASLPAIRSSGRRCSDGGRRTASAARHRLPANSPTIHPLRPDLPGRCRPLLLQDLGKLLYLLAQCPQLLRLHPVQLLLTRSTQQENRQCRR